MFYLSIDIAKNTPVASLIDSDGNTIFKSHSFSISIVGINSLIDKLNNISTKDILIGLESTGHYWISVYSYLIEKDYDVIVINPIQTDGWRKATEIRKRKTDAIDSLLIADFIRYGNYESTSLSNENYLNLRNMTRFRHYLIEESSSLKNIHLVLAMYLDKLLKKFFLTLILLKILKTLKFLILKKFLKLLL